MPENLTEIESHLKLPRGADASSASSPVSALSASTPYRVRIVRTEEQFRKALAVRREAYSKKHPELAADVAQSEHLDYTNNAIILLVEDSRDGRPLATLRLNSGAGVTAMLRDLNLPAETASPRMAYISRMAAVGSGREKSLARALANKALFQICMARQFDRMLILPALPRDKLYYRWGFTHVFPDGQPRKPAMLGGIEAHVLQLEVYAIERNWRNSNHALYDFIFRTFHPEIEVFSSLSSIAHRTSETIGAAAGPEPLPASRPPMAMSA